MKRILFILSIASLLLPCNDLYSEPIENIAKSVVFIREQEPQTMLKGNRIFEVWLKEPGKDKFEQKLITKSGTGVLIGYQGKIFLLTAAHVIKGMSNNAEILWNTISGKTKQFTFKDLQKGIKGSKWFTHPKADIAVHPFGVTEEADHVVIGPKLWDHSVQYLHGIKVYVFGFPLNLGVQEVLSPISKKAELASSLTTIDSPNIDPNLKFLILDDPLAQGYSGAPVFTSPEPRMEGGRVVFGGGEHLLGVTSMVLQDITGGKLSLIVPIFYLKEIFKSDEFKNYLEEYDRSKSN